MMYIEQKHPAGKFLRCDGCGRQPSHVLANGRLASEPPRTVRDLLEGKPCQRHRLECTRCDRRTKLHESLDLAVVEWGTNHAQSVLPLRLVSRKAAAA